MLTGTWWYHVSNHSFTSSLGNRMFVMRSAMHLFLKASGGCVAAVHRASGSSCLNNSLLKAQSDEAVLILPRLALFCDNTWTILRENRNMVG